MLFCSRYVRTSWVGAWDGTKRARCDGEAMRHRGHLPAQPQEVRADSRPSASPLRGYGGLTGARVRAGPGVKTVEAAVFASTSALGEGRLPPVGIALAHAPRSHGGEGPRRSVCQDCLGAAKMVGETREDRARTSLSPYPASPSLPPLSLPSLPPLSMTGPTAARLRGGGRR